MLGKGGGSFLFSSGGEDGVTGDGLLKRGTGGPRGDGDGTAGTAGAERVKGTGMLGEGREKTGGTVGLLPGTPTVLLRGVTTGGVTAKSYINFIYYINL